MKMSQRLFVIGLNHRTTPIELREKWSTPSGKRPALLQHLQARCGLPEVVLISTCNRLEIYGANPESATQPRRILEAISEVIHDDRAWVNPAEPHAYHFEDAECIRHLFRVASSLDSLVVGETEIVGQVKTAYQLAHSCGATGSVLNRLFQTALSVSKQVRTRSRIGRWSTSVGAIAVDLAEKVFGDGLDERTILIIGAGKMGETTLRHLSNRGARTILIANRSSGRADELALEFRGEAVPFSELSNALVRADVVISSTSSPHPLVSKEDLADARAARGGRPMVLIDLAVPRNIDPATAELDGVYLYNIDELAEIARVHLECRQAEADMGEKLVAGRAEELAARLAMPHSIRARNDVLGFLTRTVNGPGAVDPDRSMSALFPSAALS